MTIPFNELRKLNDSVSFVWTALTFNPSEKADIEKYLKAERFLPPDATILEMKQVAGNVLGDAGRTDVLFITTPTTFNPLARLTLDGLKWTSDFIDNYGEDYGEVCRELATVDNDE